MKAPDTGVASTAPRLNTGLLFLRLLRTLDVEMVCDVGSMNGSDALRFRQYLRSAEIISLEPNPSNFRLMQADTVLASARIELVPAAAADFNGDAPFHLVPSTPGPEEMSRRGMGSLFKRTDARFAGPTITTQVLRLDDLLQARAHERRLALWIDAEGSAFEVLTGARGIARSLQLVHVEVESRPCIGADQHLCDEVARLLGEWGFIELATNVDRDATQFDAVYVRADLDAITRLRISSVVMRLRLRRMLGKALASLCPGCLRAVRERLHL